MKYSLRLMLLTVAMMLFGFNVRAGNITEAEARAKAQSFLRERLKSASGKRLAPARTTPRLQNATTGTPALYVFNVGDADGFVIVSGDDRARSVLGYADRGSFDANHAPASLLEMMAIYARQMERLDKTTATADSAVQARHKVRRRISGQMADVEPLLTTTWDQGEPYNAYCPTLDDQTALTGCVATAMAQIANFHRYPTNQVPSLAAYISSTNKINVSAWGATTFDWANMLPNYNGEYTSDQQRAVATLMRYCGQAAQMDYGFTSGAYNGDAFVGFREKLGYSASAQFKSAAGYSADGWEGLIYKEVRAKRPVYYSALNGDEDGPECGGHAFVIDGYRADGNYFHVNWGWGGACNGYFNLFALDPYAPEAAPTATGWHYQMLAIIGLAPEAKAPQTMDFQTDVPLFLRHAKTGQYLTGGNNYRTTTSLTQNGLDDTVNEPIIFNITEETADIQGAEVTGYVLRMDGSFTFEGRTIDYNEVFRETENNCYVDRSGRGVSYLWKFQKVGNYYHIFTADGDPFFGGDGYRLGHRDDDGTRVQMFSPDEEADFDWEFVACTYVQVTGVELYENSIRIQQNDDYQLTHVVLPEDARNKRVRWETDDESIATVDDNGLVHGTGIGTTRVRVISEDGGHEAECEVIVIAPIVVSNISLSQESITLNGGDRVALVAMVEPDNAQNKSLKWTVADPTVASVSNKGEVRGKRVGTTTVTATATDGSGVAASCTVNVLSDDTSSLETGWIIPRATETPWQMLAVVGNEPDNDAEDNNWTMPDYDDTSWESITGPLHSGSDFFENGTNISGEWVHYYMRGTFYLPQATPGIYKINSLHDDGVRIWINGNEVVDGGCNGSYEDHFFSHDVLVAGDNTIAIDYWGDGNPNGFDFGLYFESLPATYSDRGLTYALDAETMTATIIGCEEYVSEVRIPEVVSHCAVSGIADNAFASAESLSLIEVPFDKPWAITEAAFTDDIYARTTLKVPYAALDAYGAAAGWSRFENVDFIIPDTYTDEQGIVYSLRDGSYYAVTGHTDISGDITIASEILGIPVTVIDDYSFEDCWDITSVEIPSSIRSIRNGAFSWCGNLTKVTGMEGILASENWDAWDVFYGSGIQQPVYSKEVFFYMPSSITGDYEVPAGIKLTAQGSMRESQLSSITLPASLTDLGDDTFQDCPNLTDIYCYAAIPPVPHDGVWQNGFDRSACTVHVPASAVEDYQNAEEWRDMGSIVGIVTGELADLTINVATAGTLDDALFDAAVAEAEISDKVLVRNLTVTGNINADDVAYLNTLPNTLYNMYGLDLSGAVLDGNAITEGMFSGTLYKNIVLPASVSSIAAGAFRDSRRLQTITLPAAVQTIEANAFAGCTTLATVTFAAGCTLKRIEESAFDGLSSLKSITLPESLEYIGPFAFRNCGLTSIAIPDNVTEVGHRSLQGCGSLKSITIGNGITSIPDCWAEYSNNLEAVTIGKKVSQISWRAFPGFSIKHVYSYAKITPSWNDSFYDGINSEAVLHVYENSVKRYQKANGWNEFPTIVGDLGTYTTYELAVNVAETGTFSEALATAMTAAGCEDMTDITRLTVTGTVNGDDLYYLRDNVGRTLDRLDLGAVTVEGNNLCSYALSGSGFEELVLPPDLEKFGDWHVLLGCTNLKDIYYAAVAVPSTVKEALDGFDRSACTLHVYEEMVEVFENAELWNDFNIVGDLGTIPNTTPMNEADYADLCALYNTFGGDSWHTKWLTGKNVQTASRWRGVTFDEDGYVTGIVLRENALSGDVSEFAFTGLNRLKSIDLSGNALTGDILSLAASLPRSCKLNVERQDFGYQGEMTLYEACQYADLPSIAYWNSESSSLVSTLIGVAGVCQFYHEGTDDGHYWDSYIYADGGMVNNFQFYWPSPATVECFYPHHFTFTYSYEKGDANMDDALNVLDLQSTLNYSNGQEWGLFNFAAADTYGPDDDINVQDIVATVNILLAQDEQAHPQPLPSRRGEGSAVEEHEACITVEGNQLVLYSARPVAALDLRLAGVQPEALDWNIETLGFATAATAQTGGTHAIAYSLIPREIAEGRTVLATIRDGSEPSVTAAILSDAKARPISVGRTLPTGIDGMAGGTLSDGIWTDLGGRRIANPQLSRPQQKGVYVHGGKKVVVTPTK